MLSRIYIPGRTIQIRQGKWLRPDEERYIEVRARYRHNAVIPPRKIRPVGKLTGKRSIPHSSDEAIHDKLQNKL
ncbi:hypothetical protein XELAEV_18014670mg [Xenopus laevis]|uniref:Uncharacterized protein n=1 Tax=Xenopus laevis TaxID=8355 RepID=A0A974DIV4_XENLA|nr:hypothetical protein XELAEV_18014670mg [Xenopus laevis]